MSKVFHLFQSRQSLCLSAGVNKVWKNVITDVDVMNRWWSVPTIMICNGLFHNLITFQTTSCYTSLQYDEKNVYKDQFQGVVDQRTDKYNFHETEMTWKIFLPHKITVIKKELVPVGGM